MASRVLFAWIPWLHYVGLNGSLVRGEASQESDIDMMVVTSPGHIYTVRFIMLSVISLIGIKRNQNNIAGRLCVNCFQTSDQLDIRPHNKKVARSHKYMVALVDDPISNFQFQISKHNMWVNKYHIPISKHQLLINNQITPFTWPWNLLRHVFELILWPIGWLLEKLLKYIQLKKIARHPLTASNRDKIITTDKELMFHPNKD